MSMFKFLASIFLLTGAFFTWQRFDAFYTPAPCTVPLTYSIGSFDRRFKLDQKDFLKALSEAESVWEEALRGEGFSSNKELFNYNAEKGKLAVNLVYDYRQEVTDELSQIESSVKSNESTYHALEKQYLGLKASYSQMKSAYDQAVATFDTHNLSYEAQVEAWNNSSRTSQSEFQALEKSRVALATELSALKAEEARLNGAVKQLNTMVGELNTLAKSLNLNAKEYNAIGASRGETFTGGLYTSDASGERIDIFEFSNHTKLVRVLAHELGHALGLDHVADKNAIMYESNDGTATTLAQADLKALTTLCSTNK